jgi:hypothetical protein
MARCRYFNYLLINNKLLLALFLATELQSRQLCLALSAAAEQRSGETAKFVALTARAAHDLRVAECTSPVSVSFV